MYVWALDFDHHTIRWIKRGTGDYVPGGITYWLIGPGGEGHIDVPSDSINDLDFIFDYLAD
jgi:hypothetical protein